MGSLENTGAKNFTRATNNSIFLVLCMSKVKVPKGFIKLLILFNLDMCEDKISAFFI